MTQDTTNTTPGIAQKIAFTGKFLTYATVIALSVLGAGVVQEKLYWGKPGQAVDNITPRPIDSANAYVLLPEEIDAAVTSVGAN